MKTAKPVFTNSLYAVIKRGSSYLVVLASNFSRVQDSLPEVGQWCLVMVDRNLGDFFDRMGKPRFEVFAAELYDIDSEGYGYWRRWKMSDGRPMGKLDHVAWWMPYPKPFTE